MTVPYPRYLDAGEAALVVEFGETADPAVNAQVRALDEAILSLTLEGVRETVPTYRSLMIHYDPLLLARKNLVAAIEQIEAAHPKPREPKALWMLPCCYAPEFAEDLFRIAELTKLKPERVVALHSGATYRVYMYGFAPGFCYLGPPHPANAVLLGGGLTLVSTFAMPTGWYVIGRTPERMFAPTRAPIFLVEIGDALKFEPVDAATFAALDARAAAGEIVAKRKPLR